MAVPIGYSSAGKLISCVAKLSQLLENHTRPLLSKKHFCPWMYTVLSEVPGNQGRSLQQKELRSVEDYG